MGKTFATKVNWFGNSKYLGSLAMSGLCDWYYVFCYFFLLAASFRKISCFPKNIRITKKIPKSKMSTWGITSIKSDSNAHHFMQSVRSYLPVKTCIISKPFNWFAKQVNCLVSISTVIAEKYFRTDYNIECVQGNVHRPLVSSHYNHGVKMTFFTRRTVHVRLNG